MKCVERRWGWLATRGGGGERIHAMSGTGNRGQGGKGGQWDREQGKMEREGEIARVSMSLGSKGRS